MPKTATLCEYKKDKLFVTLPGEIDHHAAKAIREEIDRAIFYYRPKTLVLILAEVSFMDSAGLGLILGRYTRMQELSGNLVIADPTPQTVKILKLAGLEKKIAIEASAAHKEKTNKATKG